MEGSGSCSILYTVVRATIVRQHSSCRLRTLLLLNSLSIPFLCKAILDNSLKLSLILKSHNGETSKKAILFLTAYASASLAVTCLLNAKCSLLPTNTFGTPGACCKRINKLFKDF